MALHEPPAITTNYLTCSKLCIFIETLRLSSLSFHTVLCLRVKDDGLKAVFLEKSRNTLTLIFQYNSGSPDSLSLLGFLWSVIRQNAVL